MGCLGSKTLPDDQAKKNEENKHIIIDTDNFIETDYPIFSPDFYSKKHKNIQKIYTELIVDNYTDIYKIHKIFITIDFQKNISTVTEIEKVIGNETKQHLTKQEFKGCRINKMRPFIEKYNSIFNIICSDWLTSTPTTDIFIKSEKNDKNEIKTLCMFYEKKGLKLKCSSTNIKNTNIPKEEKKDVKPNELVNMYNECLGEFNLDTNHEIFYFDGNISKINYDYSNYFPPVPKIINNQINNNNFKNYNSNNGYNNNNSNYNRNYRQSSNNSNSDYNRNNNRRNSSNDIRGESGNVVGRVDNNGDIRGHSGNVVGKFDNNGDIRGESGNVVGRFDDNGDIRGQSGNVIGRLDDNGDVRGGSGNVIGRIDDNGDVRGESGNVIGNVGSMSKAQAAYLFFFK